jgi:uncharacterized protein (DUF1684 family)
VPRSFDSGMTSEPAGDARFRADWAAWRRQHEARVADPHGYLAATGLHWLGPGPERYDDAPGAWSAGPDGVEVELSDLEEISVGGQLIRGRHRFGPLAERQAIRARADDAVLEIARHGGADFLRPRHPANPLRTRFRGCPTFPPDRRWVTRGRYLPFDRPQPVAVGAVVEGLQHVYESPGRIEFRLAGAELALTAFNGSQAGRLDLVFTDQTAGVTTYPASRVLQVAAPGPGGVVTLDFNRAVNLACAYTSFSTCPLPPPENRLAIAVEAGEQMPSERFAPGG